MTADASLPPSLPPTTPRGSRGRLVLLLAALLACGALGLLLHQSRQRELQLGARANSLEVELDKQRARARSLAFENSSLSSRNSTLDSELDKARSKAKALSDSLYFHEERITELELSLSDCQSDLSSSERANRTLERSVFLARDTAETAESKLKAEQATNAELVKQLRKCTTDLNLSRGEALSMQSDLDDVARAIRYGTIGLTEIPPPGPFSTPGFLSVDCDTLLLQYNDLVDRFNASLRRNQQLGKIIDGVTSALR